MRTRHFRDLLVWQKSMQLTREVYSQTAALPKSEIFGLTSQMRRAAVSIPSNIAEGHGRLTNRDRQHFVATARGSLLEIETQIRIASNLDYIDRVTTLTWLDSAAE